MPDFALSSADALRDHSDEVLLAACRAGDADAFLTLARRHHPALCALARCWPGGAHAAERDVATAWSAYLRWIPLAAAPPSAAPAAAAPPAASPARRPVRALVAREVVVAAVERTRAVLEPAPPEPLDAERFFAAEHALWPGEWADPPRPWGSIARRRLGQRDVPRLLARRVHELGIAPSAMLTLCDVHGWPVSECAIALQRPEAEVRAFLRAGREALRATLEAEIDTR
jgi:DNA-directed RNA polymerase specialized sigma24 family protein